MDFYSDDACTTTVLVTLKAALGLFGIWLGCSSLTWFWRGMIALATTALLIPPRAYDPAIGMLVELGVIACVIGLARRWKQHQDLRNFFHATYRLVDLFRVTFLLALGLALLMYLVRRPRYCELPWLCFESFLQACVTLIVAAVVLVRMKWFWKIGSVLLLITVWYAVSVVEFRTTSGAENWETYSSIADELLPTFFLRNGLIACTQFLLCAALYIGLAGTSESRTGWWTRSARIVARALAAASGGLAGTVMLFLWWRMTFLPTPPERLIPSPNGFDLVTEAEKLIQGDTWLDPEAVTTAELAAFVKANQRPIELARAAAQQSWKRPLTFSAGSDEPFVDVVDLRNLMRLLNRSVRLALKEQRTDDAINDAIAGVQIGSEVRNGGLIVDFLVGNNFQSGVIAPLKSERSKLNVAQCRQLLAALQVVEREQLPLAHIEEVDRIWSLHQYGYQCALIDTINSLRPRQSQFYPFENTYNAERRLLIVDLAIRTFRFEQGRTPESLDELTPGLLSELPVDPFTQQPLIYRRTETGDFVLYSSGPDRDDDGGMSMSWQAANTSSERNLRNGDFFLDYWDETTPSSKPTNAAPGVLGP